MTKDKNEIDQTETSASPPTVTQADHSGFAASHMPERIGQFKIRDKIG